MHRHRTALMCGVLVLAGCGSKDECSLPRQGDEQTCDSFDGGQLRFVVGEPMSDVSAYCASPCVDVYGSIAIAGYEDLRTVPFLPKVRMVRRLGINIDGLKDLRGLERVDVLGELSLSGLNGDTARKTLEGLTDDEMEAFTLDQVSGLASLEGSPVARLEVFAVERSSVEELDLGNVQVANVNVDGNESLRSVSLPSGVMSEVRIRANPTLSGLEWRPGLQVTRWLEVDANPALSSCLVQQLVEQTVAGVRRTEFIFNNGPCP